MQCTKKLDFIPRTPWPEALPAFAWKGDLLCGFERKQGQAIDLWELNHTAWIDAFTAIYPTLALSELARLQNCLQQQCPKIEFEFGESLFAFYGLRWCESLSQTLQWLNQSPMEFQNWVDEKKLGPRDLAPLVTLPMDIELKTFLRRFVQLPLSKSQAVRTLENAVDLHLMGQPLSDLTPSADFNVEVYVQKLEAGRRPMAAMRDESWQREVAQWPWPAQVQAEWRRQGDRAGLELKLRAESPDDFKKKLERLTSIGESWSCRN